MADALRALAALPDPVGEVVRGSTLANGLEIRQVRVPMGVVGMVYEARPNVTVDAAGLALKSGNAVVLRGRVGGGQTNPRWSRSCARRWRAGPPDGRRCHCSTRAAATRSRHLMTARGYVDVLSRGAAPT